MSNEDNRRACVWGRCNGTMPREGGPCDRCGTVVRPSTSQPSPGSWADVARMMASLSAEDGGDDSVDWDAWKDEMKETDGKGY